MRTNSLLDGAAAFEGTYQTKSVADGSAVDEGTWKATRAE
jgi:hypothetical protein